jgi:hypothetical protein
MNEATIKFRKHLEQTIENGRFAIDEADKIGLDLDPAARKDLEGHIERARAGIAAIDAGTLIATEAW